MFGWFSSGCPVDEAAKQWIEDRLNWLSEQFGRDVFTRRAVILPTAEFFPQTVDGSEESVRNLLDQVCGYMDVDPQEVRLKLFTRKSDLWLMNEKGKYLPPGPAGMYEAKRGRAIVHIEMDELCNLSGLVGTMAHELAHLRLMGERRVMGREFDNELLTDLTVVFHGLGIFLGNSPRNWDSHNSTWPGTNLVRPEYMTVPMYAYALAHAAWHRNEAKPAWSKYLSFDLAPNFRQALRFLNRTNDSKFSPQSAE